MAKATLRLEDCPEALTARHLARVLGCDYKTALQLIHDNKVPAIKHGRFYRVPRRALLRMLEEGKV